MSDFADRLAALPFYWWLVTLTIAVVAIYYTWGRKAGPQDPNLPPK
jgi:hypothetical protein